MEEIRVTTDDHEEIFTHTNLKRYKLMLEHSEICQARSFMRKGDTSVKDSINNHIKVAVNVALFDSDDCLLVTRRCQNLKHFPGAWVFPGGHLDP